ncbi:hypothetical protein B0J13DRAFT_554128 [Dactylonectria estremocensis]|uniref:Uncharacterized protein n=1 Tax=Dactylonectria estremocensis TaxID=1079267 RepID=A0A9P9J3L4_9HYPO|nr:hypothetical protein B0J13DRAFT_554128 [Dactylonectria estremocensis]
MSAPSPSSSSSSTDSYSSSSSSSTPQSTLQELFGTLCKQKLLEEVDKLKTAIENDDPQEVIMSIPMLLALTICPAMLGTQEAIRQSQSKSKREEHRARRCNLVVSCVKPSIRSRDINNKLIVLKDSKLYIANEHPLYNHDSKNNVSKGYPFSGYFLPYPDSEYEGLVSTISDDPPMLNWIYVDKDTYAVKYGVRAEAQEHITGPFDCTKQDRRMTLEGWEGFCAVEELPGIWSLFYDRDDNGLKNKVPMGTRVLEVELTRREKKEPKPEPDADVPTTLEEKWKQHKEQSQENDDDREAFLASGMPKAAPAEPIQPAQPTATTRAPSEEQKQKLEALSEGMRRLGLTLDNIKVSESQAAPSVATNDYSVWSGARKAADGDSSSVTAASSVSEKHNDTTSVLNGSDGDMYKKPYVEDVAV